MSEKMEENTQPEDVQTDAGQAVAEAEPVELLEPEDNSEPVTVIVRQQSSSPWAAASVFITMLVLAFLAFWMIFKTPERIVAQTGKVVSDAAVTVAKGIGSAFQVTVNANTIIGSTIENVRSKAKFVVMTANVEVDLEKSNQKKVLWDYLDLGTMTTRVRALDNQVQYYIDLSQFDRENITFDPQANRVIVEVPEPKLDEEFVDVQSDPAKIQVETAAGWARFDSQSGKHLEEQARRELRKEVIRAGGHVLLREKARQTAIERLSELLGDLRHALNDGIDLEIRFKEDARPPENREIPT
jgi:hypothetical protein